MNKNYNNTKDRVYMTLNKKSLIYNIKNIKKHIKDLKICAVVKDNAYNHGELDIMHTIGHYVDYFATSTIQEALSVRKANKTKNILILSHINEDDYNIAIKNNIVLTCSYFKQIKDINKIASKMHKIAKIHIAINTGMNRIGFPISEKTIHELKIASKLNNIELDGIFSHYACCDTYDQDILSKQLTDIQKERFDEIVAKLRFEGVSFKIRHIANSAGIIYDKYENTDMVRPGIILYGVKPDISNKNILKIKQALTLKTNISYIKEIDKNQYISYGATYKSKRKMKVATIQVGYGDGYPRILSNIQDVYINKKRCRIIGRITMDQTMVDVTNVKCKINDQVELFGPHISIYELAKNANTIPYEIFCGLNKRINRELI